MKPSENSQTSTLNSPLSTLNSPLVPPGYKQTEVGVIPENWKIIDLSHVCTLQRGFDITEATRVPGTVPVYSSSGISYYHNKAMVSPPGVVTGRKGILGKVFLINEPFWPHDTTLWVKDFRGNAPAYVALVLQSFHLERLDAATSVPTLNRNNLAGYSIALPSTKAEQEAIAEALSDADALIESLEQLLTKKRHLKQGAMQELLTGKKRLPGFEVKPGYKKTEVGVIPEDWQLVPLGKVITEFRGGAPLKPSDFTRIGVQVLPKGGVGRIGWLHVEEEDLQYCSIEYATTHRRNQVDETFTIVVLRDLVPSGPSIGLMVQIRNRETFVLAQGVYGFKVNSYAVPSYLVQLSNTQWYRKLANSIMVGSTQVHITNKEFKRAIVPLPPPPEQEAIAAILSDMDAEIAALETKLTKTRHLKQGMMQELLTGKTRLVDSGKLIVESGEKVERGKVKVENERHS